jgi:hypothetical protein
VNIARNQTTRNTKENDLARKDNNQREENRVVGNKEKADNSEGNIKETAGE